MSRSSLHAPIAVVGMACRLPGADDLDAFWALLASGGDAVVEFPPHRLDRGLYYDARKGQRGKTYSTIGGLVSERPPVCGDESYDVCHRIFADVALAACRHAGMGAEAFASRETGVFVGLAGGSDELGDIALATLAGQAYESLRGVAERQGLDRTEQDALLADVVARFRHGRRTRTADGGPKTDARWAAELVGDALGLSGPRLVLDAACSSSLVAFALGALALDRGEVDAAIVGGASYAQQNSLILFSQAQSCTARGSRPFDEGADGLVGSEGYAAMVLKTEERARADGDTILAVVRGIGLSTDGRGRHLWAPRKEGQIAAMKRAYGTVVDPAGVQYVEAHATSTQVGDATELESMVAFFGDRLPAPIPIGSVKSNIGHTLETSGLASLTKVILAMQREVIPPTIHVDTPNRSIAWDAIPFTVARAATPWPRPAGDVRRGAVSAFGIGGLNVHLVVEEPRPESPPVVRVEHRSQEPIAIVGRGLVVPGARTVGEFRALLDEGRSAIVDAPDSRWPGGVGVGAGPWTSPTSRGGYVLDYQYDYLTHRIPPRQLATANPLQFMLLDAAEQALLEAGTLDRERTAVVVGTVFAGEFGNQLLLGMRFPELRRALAATLTARGLGDDARATLLAGFEERFFEAYPALLDDTGSFTSSTLASRITKAFDLQGGALAVEAGESLAAVRTACTLLRGGACASVVCAGAQRMLDLASFEALARKGAFDVPGYAPAEGVGALVLKRLDHARHDGNRVLGLILGDGSGQGGGDAAEATAAARRALASAGFERDQVRVIEVGGGPGRAPERQAAALGALFGGAERRTPDLARVTGHLGAAEGAVALIRATLEEGVGLQGHHALSDRGRAAHLVFGPPPPDRSRAGSGAQLRLGATTRAKLRERLLYAGAGEGRTFAETDHHRLAVVGADRADLAARLVLAETHFDAPGTRALLEEQGIHFGVVANPPARVALVFSGQGSQYPGMMRALVEVSPAARHALEEADRGLAAAGLPTFAELAWGETARLDEDPVTTQIAVLVADTLAYAALREAGIEGDCVCGHSFGEIAAMVAARVLTLEEAIRVTVRRARALGEADPDGGLLSVQASLDQVRALIAEQDRPLFVTHHNAPLQVVVGGSSSDLAGFGRRLAEAGLKHTPLKVPGALHSPLVRAAQEPLRAALADETLRPPTKLFYSNVTADRVSAPEGFVANLVAQLVEPLDYPALIARLVRDGVGALVEVGPGHVLTRLHRQIVGPDVVCVGSDHPRRGAGEQLARVRAALETIGALTAGAAPTATAPAQPGTIAEFDATAERRRQRRSAAAARPEAAAPASPPPTPPTDADAPGGTDDGPLTQLLLDLVVDLTGYPRAAISLDWDLEADLGLDSIKRAQLVGELSEGLDLKTTGEAGAALASLHTLREILAYLGGASASATAPPPPATPEPASAEPLAYQEGFALGRRHAAALRAALRRDAIRAPAAPPSTPAARGDARLDARERARLQGLADGGGVHVGNVLAYRLRHGIDPTQAPAAPLHANGAHPNGAHANGTHPNGAHPNGGPGEPISARYVMRMVDRPRASDVPLRALTGSAVVVGADPVADRLRERLAAAGVRAHALAPDSSAAAVAELDRLWSLGPIDHLFLVAGRSPDALDRLDADAWRARRDRVLMTPFALCQRWLGLVKAAGRMDEATLTGVTALGGDFGFGSTPPSFEGGALTGLLKAIVIESWVAGHRRLSVKVVDAPPTESPDAVAEAALGELAVPSYEGEVAVVDGARRVVRAVRADLAPPDPARTLGETWVCTGGARGITAVVAGELGRRFGLKLHLIGRAPRTAMPAAWTAMWSERRTELKLEVMDAARARGENAIEAWKQAQKSLEIEETLGRLAAQGVPATYHSCDISDRAALDRVLRAVRAEGPIDGILHGAGSSRDAKFEHKEAHRVDQCFHAKVDGTLTLMDLTQDDALKFFVAFGSVSGRFGANGHADYSMANDMMAKLVDWYRRKRPEVGAVTVHWHAWGDVGMATKAETQLGLQMVDMSFMPAAEGVEHLVRELQAGAPEAEVLVTDPRYHARFHAHDAAAAEAPLRPLLDGGGSEQKGDRAVFSLVLDPEKEVFLKEHRFDGRPMLPLVMSLEMVSEAARGGAAGPFVVRSIETHHGLRFQGSAAQTVRVESAPAGGDAVGCSVVADFSARDGTLLEADRPILRAVVDAPDRRADEVPRLDAPPPDDLWNPVVYDGPGSRFHHGPSMRALRTWCIEDGVLWGSIVAPALIELAGSGRSPLGWKIHGAVLDASLYAVGVLAWSLGAGGNIPVGMDRLWVGRLPAFGEECLVRVTERERRDRRGVFDFAVYGANGDPLMEARGYSVAWLNGHADD